MTWTTSRSGVVIVRNEFRPYRGANSRIRDAGGAFNAGIFMVRRCSDRKICIEKRFKTIGIRRRFAEFEIFVLEKLHHPNITEYLGAFIESHPTHPRASLFMEHCEVGTLSAYLDKRRPEGQFLAERLVWRMFGQLANAIAYLQYGIQNAVHEPNETRNPDWIGIVHRDIKPSNVFLKRRNPQQFPELVLGDFGQAIRDDSLGNWSREYLGDDMSWAPPEAPNYGYPSDIWSLGAVMQAVCRLKPDTPTPDPPRESWSTGKEYSGRLSDAIFSLMNSDPRRRPVMDQFAPSLR